jgi:hypothetical protein
MPPEDDRRVWLERLLAACERVPDNVPDPSDPYLRTLLEDVEALRARIAAELDANESTNETRRTERIGHNEALFRAVNDTARELTESGSAGGGPFSIVCECGAADCTREIEIAPAAYEQLRSDPALFAAIPGHEQADVEDVVDEREGYVVLRKHSGLPEEIARATDPRH